MPRFPGGNPSRHPHPQLAIARRRWVACCGDGEARLRALLALRPWRLAPPPEPLPERPLWQLVAVLYISLALIVAFVIGLAFLVARLVTGNAV
jgi:heme/copper-type cytochrome/quinol oxidase subunit 2